MTNDIRFVEEKTSEWIVMWDRLAKNPLNYGLLPRTAEHQGEVWQYMGTAKGHHEFRHRNHPRTNKREYVRLSEE